MSFDSWSCVMVEKGPGMLDDDVKTVLKASACNLHLQKIDRMEIKSDLCDGIIQTNWDTHSVGSRSGVLFESQVEDENGEYNVNFLLHTKDLEAGAEIIKAIEERDGVTWHTFDEPVPVAALYEFRDLRKSALN